MPGQGYIFPMSDHEIPDGVDQVERKDLGDRTVQKAVEDGVSGGKNAIENHAIRLQTDESRNQHTLSNPHHIAKKDGESDEEYIARVAKIDRFEITGIAEPEMISDEIMDTGQVKRVGGKNAEMMLDAIEQIADREQREQAKRTLKNSYQEIVSAGYVPVGNPNDEAGTFKAISPAELDDPGIPDDDVIAWKPEDVGDAIKKTGKAIKKKGSEVSHDLTKEGAILDDAAHPYKDNPDQLMDYNACAKAWKAFPAFARHPNLDAVILPAIIRNEVRHLRQDDKLVWNPLAEHESGLEKGRTIGPGNIQSRNIDRLIKKYPQLTDPEQGGIDPKHPYRDALKPEKAAWLAAAYLADYVETQEASGVKSISHHDLIKSYNPGANQKEQFDLVKKQILHIKRHHPLFVNE